MSKRTNCMFWLPVVAWVLAIPARSVEAVTASENFRRTEVDVAVARASGGEIFTMHSGSGREKWRVFFKPRASGSGSLFPDALSVTPEWFSCDWYDVKRLVSVASYDIASVSCHLEFDEGENDTFSVVAAFSDLQFKLLGCIDALDAPMLSRSNETGEIVLRIEVDAGVGTVPSLQTFRGAAGASFESVSLALPACSTVAFGSRTQSRLGHSARPDQSGAPNMPHRP